MSRKPNPALILQAVEILRSARYAIALTGAGVSTPSGIPDFRSAQSGLWTQNDPMQVASLSSFRSTPQLFFDWLRPLARQIEWAEPNPAHQALADLQLAGILKRLITQNIDGLHQRAGSERVLELHGSASSFSCTHCATRFPAQSIQPIFLEQGGIPHCPTCQNILKPDVVLFEEQLPEATWQQAVLECEQADVILVAGSSLAVFPAAWLPIRAVELGARLILVNLSETAMDEQAECLLLADVSEALPLIAKGILNS